MVRITMKSASDSNRKTATRYARFRGLPKTQEQCLLSAACQNTKKMALLLARKAAASWTQILGETSITVRPSKSHALN